MMLSLGNADASIVLLSLIRIIRAIRVQKNRKEGSFSRDERLVFTLLT